MFILRIDIMKKLLLIIIIICLGSFEIIAQQDLVEGFPNIEPVPNSILETDSFNLQFSFPCIAFEGEYGIESDGEDIYVMQWIDDSIAKYDMDGNVVDKFVIPEVGSVRDLAYDGEFYYGGSIDSSLYVIDFVTKTLIIKVSWPIIIQGIAYDDDEQTFWVSEEGSPMISELDPWGNILESWIPEGVTPDNISGLAWQKDYIIGPYLWAFCQDSTGAFIVKYNIESQAQIGYVINVSGLVTEDAISGGLYFERFEQGSWDDFVICGIIQDQLVFALDLDYANHLVRTDEKSMITEFNIYPNPATDKVSISTSYQENQLINCRILSQSGRIMFEEKLSSNKFVVNTSKFPQGTYFIQLIGIEGYSVAKKFAVVR